MRVCQFRHFGKSDWVTALAGHLSGKNDDFYFTEVSRTVQTWLPDQPYPSSFAFIVIFALSTFETGQPALAFSAAF